MKTLQQFRVIKKDDTTEEFNIEKVVNAVKKANNRALNKLTEGGIQEVCDKVKLEILCKDGDVSVDDIHNVVESVLESVNPEVAKTYREYRNYKKDFVHMLDKVYQESQRIMYMGDKSNANADSTLVTTKRSLMFNELSTQLYKKFFLTKEELQAINDGYIYCHDIGSRLLTTNCFSRDTRFITSKGVKSFADFSDGDEVIVPTHTGSWKKAVVHSYGVQKLYILPPNIVGFYQMVQKQQI